MKKLIPYLVLALLAGTVAPLWGGTVYVPLATNLPLDGNRIETEVRVTNDSRAFATVHYLFIPAWTDGTTLDRDTETVERSIPPNATIRLDEVIAPDMSGALEITAGKEVAVSARLVGVLEDGTRLPGAEMPIVTSGTATAAGDTTNLLGIGSAGGTAVTDFHLFNLSRREARCVVEIFKRFGGRIHDETLLTPPLSLLQYRDLLTLLEIPPDDDYRIAVTCDRITQPFATTYYPSTAEVLFLGPAGNGASTLDPFPSCPPGALLEVEGVFHVPTRGNEKKKIDVPMPAGQQFSRIVVDIDFTHGGWATPSTGNHSVFWLNRGSRWSGNVFGYVNLFGPNQNYAKLTTNVDLPGGQLSTVKKGAVFDSGVTYSVHYEYDTSARTIEAVISVRDGREIVRLKGTPTVNKIVTEAPGFFFVFGHGSDEAGPEVPTYGWEYANLCLRIE